MSATAHTARMIAKLLASRPTANDEIPDLIETVHRTLSELGKPRAARARVEEKVKPEAAREVAPAKRRGRKPRVVAEIISENPLPEMPAPPAAPTLLRRAEVKEPVEVTMIVPPPADGMRRGVVRWFDPQAKRGALRLQGMSSDVPVEPGMVERCHITRLFKGQEVEARVAGTPEAPQLVEFRILAAGIATHANSGMVRARQQKPVLVELKREALKRGAARDAAELLLPDRNR
ncbi:MAG TPA: hypothetical protein VFC38_09155 [Stellaceae bacterium]|nr:hypothetical protein [Stellaceae bacterium]